MGSGVRRVCLSGVFFSFAWVIACRQLVGVNDDPPTSIATPDAGAEAEADAVGDAGDDAGDDAGCTDGGLVTFSGTVQNLDTTPLAGAVVTFLERPELTATSVTKGAFTMKVPTCTSLTPVLSQATQIKTVEQTVVFHGDSSDNSFAMPTPQQYAYMETFGPSPPGSGVMRIQVVAGACTIVGAHLGTNPRSGKVVYAAYDMLPDSSYTSIQPMAPGGFVIGVGGTVVPVITDVGSPCAQIPFPIELDGFSVLGPVPIQPGAFHDVAVYVK